MSRFIRLSIITAMLVSGMVMAAVLPVSGQSSECSFLRSSDTVLETQVSIGDLQTASIINDEGTFTRIMLPGFHRSLTPGSPELPEIHRLIEIPLGADPRVEITSASVQEYSLADFNIDSPIFPAQPSLLKSTDPETVQFEWNQELYDLDRFQGHELVSVEEKGIMRSVRIANLIIRPVDYNPVTGILQIVTDIEFDIVFDNADIAATAQLKEDYYSPVFEPVFETLAYYDRPQNRDDLVNDPITMVIVANSMFEGQLDEFIDWKTEKGYTVVTGYTDEIGSSTSAIKNFIQDLYDNPVNGAPPSFVLFVGDVAQMPTWNGNTGGHVTDLDYVEYTNDYMPEIYHGRFSAANADQLQAQLDKTLEYDQFLMPDPSYLGEVVMVAGMDSYHGDTWANGQINYGTTYYFNEEHGITSYTYLYPQSGSNSQNIINDISEGVGYANYTAHCSSNGWADPSFTVSDINTLQNDHEYPLGVGNCCSSNEFDSGTCFGEAFLRAEEKGGIGYIGGSNSTYWDEDYWWGVGSGNVVTYPTYEATGLGAYDGMFHDHGESEDDWYITNYAIIMAGNLAVVEGGGNSNYYWEIYHLMGDPSLSTYLGVPSENTVSHLPFLQIGVDSFTINADPYSYAGLSMDGMLYGAGQVGASGVLELAIDPILTGGTATIVVTRQNREPYIGTVEVGSADGPYVIVDDCLVVGDTNNNGDIDYGETIYMLVQAENVGVETATNVIGTVTSDDPYITMIDGTVTFDAIEPGGVEASLDVIEFSISQETPDGHSASFDVHFAGDSGEWDHYFTISINAYCVLGDMNADWVINVLDIIQIVNIILNIGDGPTDLELCAADVDENGIINILDVIQVIGFVINQDYGCRMCRPAGYDDSAVLVFDHAGLSLTADVPVAGFQFTVQGQNLSLNHDLGLEIETSQANGTTTVLAYSPGGNPLPEGEHRLINSDSEIIVENIIVADLYGHEMSVASRVIPEQFNLSQNHPNPFNPETMISFDLPSAMNVDLVIHDLLGQEIIRLADGVYGAGSHSVVWNSLNADGRPVPAGMYFYTLSTGTDSMTRKMILLK